MPKITAKKSRFFKLLGEDLSFQQLEDLSFDFGIEVEEDEDSIVFEIAANRADLLCVESLAYHLRLYLGRDRVRHFKFLPAQEKIFVRKNTKLIRPYIVGAVLRNVELDQDAYESFIDMQDKLHHNLCRKRKLVAIGTHDLDKIKGPFYYDGQDPNKIIFKALKQQQELTAVDLFKVLENDLYLRNYLPIIKDSPVYPVVLDSTNSVLSLPPIINSEYSKISAQTKNILIESTCTDYTRAQAALACLVSGFSQYCTTPFDIEMIEVIYEETGEVRLTPQNNERLLQTTLTYINKILGINIDSQKVVQLLERMGINSKAINEMNIDVTVPFYRTDILQQCDIAEDVGISYGYNNIIQKIPESQTVGGETRLNKLSDMVREEVALCGFVECLNFVLCSINEITTLLNRPIEDKNIVHISNSKSAEFECARTTLISAVLKTLKSNSTQKLPVQLFEVADVVIKGNKTESDGWIPEEGIIGAINKRKLCALVSDNSTSGLDIIHGLLDQVMLKLKITNDINKGYYIQKSQDSCFFTGLQAAITYKGQSIGIMGVIHPKVLENIKWDYPTSLIEIDLQPLFKDFK